MSQRNWWARIWTLNDSKGDDSFPIARKSKFWFEPVYVEGILTFYYLRFDAGVMGDCFKDLRLYPMGIREMPAPAALPGWNPDDEPTREKFMAAATAVRKTGNAHPVYIRLEGTLWVPANEYEKELVIARFYYFKGAENGRDWFVFDIISSAEAKVQDGTGHGDEE
jgi:hypothetical protein